MSDLVKFEIPASFVIAHALPTPEELVYGYRDGWLSRSGVVSVALKKYNLGTSLHHVEERLALLLKDELYSVTDLIDELAGKTEVGKEHGNVWLFLALAWLYQNSAEFEDPLEVVEMIYTDFGHPEEIENMVRYMPLPEGQDEGEPALWRNLRLYVERSKTKYLWGRLPS